MNGPRNVCRRRKTSYATIRSRRPAPTTIRANSTSSLPILCAGNPSGAAHLGSADHPVRRTCWRVCAVMAASSRDGGSGPWNPSPFMSAITCRGRMCCRMCQIAECGHIGIKRHRCAAPWRAPPPGYAPGRPPGTGAPIPGCGHRSTRLIHSADGAARGDLGLQDGRRRLVEVVIWLRWKPGHPPAFGPGQAGRAKPRRVGRR
jgi:hypothetical protein